jgi:hypothetical protein
VVFWESVRASTNRAELEAYLAKYPEGTFAPLARARIDSLAAATAKAAPPAERKAEPRPPAAPPPAAAAPAKSEPSQEALFWESVRNSSNPAELRAYLDKYPQGTFAPLARARLEAIAAADAKAAAEPKLNIPPRPTSDAATETLRQPAKAAAAAPAPSPAARRYAGKWKATVACDQFEEYAAFTAAVNAEFRDDTFYLERGTRGQPGWFTLRGTPSADGRLELAGNGISGLQRYRGNSYFAEFGGRFEGDRYQGPGRMGKRACTISLARAGD